MMEKVKLMVVDDEKVSRKNIIEIVRCYCKGFDVIGEAGTVLNALKALNSISPDLILLDVEMPDGNGFEFLECISDKGIPFMFLTAHSEYALNAFRYQARDYLLKPVDIDLFLDSLNRFRENLLLHVNKKGSTAYQTSDRENTKPYKLAIHSQNETEYVNIDSIIRFEGAGCYTNIYLKNGRKITVSKVLHEFENLLDRESFTRVHRSHLINMHQITKFVKRDGLVAKMSDDFSVPISSRKKDDFVTRLKSLAI